MYRKCSNKFKVIIELLYLPFSIMLLSVIILLDWVVSLVVRSLVVVNIEAVDIARVPVYGHNFGQLR